MTKYHLRRRLIIAAVAVALPLTAVTVGAGSPSAAAAPPGGSASAAAVPGLGKAAVPANTVPCTTAGAICAPGGEYTLTYTVTGTGDCSWTASIAWGDGTAGTVSFGSAGFTEEHTYADPGDYDLSVTGSGISADPDTTCTFYPYDAEIEVPLTCTHTYQTVVTEHAGALTLPELDTDKVTVDWCTDGNGHFQILSSHQDPAVEQDGFFSFSGQQIGILSGLGITFGVTPTTGPAPAIDNQDLADPSATASGLTFNGSFNAATLLATIASGYVTKVLAAEFVLYVRTGKLGLISIKALKWWGQQVVTPAISYLTNHYVPGLVARWVTGQPVSQLKDLLVSCAETFAAAVTQSLEALGSNATLTSVINAIQSAIQKAASAVTYTLQLWEPQIDVTIDGSMMPPVSNAGTQNFSFINVQDPPIEMTTRLS
jgi:hypothetical protein